MRRAALAAATAAALTAVETRAAPLTGGRCALLGQVAITEWLGLLTVLGGGHRAVVDTAMTRTDRSVSLYAAAACDGGALAAAMDCVLASDAGADARDRARRCLVEAGLASGE